MRITAQMMMSQYKGNVNDALSSMNKAMQKAYDYRSFEVPSDDPLAAAQTFQVHWETSLNANYQTNVSNLTSSVNTAESILQNIDSILTSANSTSTLQGITGTSSLSDRQAIAKQILSYRDTIISEMNSKYSDSYLFGGSNSSSVPFTVTDGQLYYRGVNVNTGKNINGASETLTYDYTDSSVPPVTTQKTMQINFGKDIGDKLNADSKVSKIEISQGSAFSTTVSNSGTDYTISITMPSTATKGDLQSYLQGTYSGSIPVDSAFSLTGVDSSITSTAGITISGLPDNAGDKPLATSATITDASTTGITDVVDLSKLANESVYVDIGLGIASQGGAVNAQSAFDAAMPGLAYLGYGTSDVKNDDGTTTADVPNNVYTLLTDIAASLNDEGMSGTALMDKISPYITNLTNTQKNLEAKQTEVGTSLQLLSDTSTYLQNMSSSLDDRDNNVEFVDATDAITDYSMQQYCYEAALQVGSQILQKSLMDYLT